MKYKETEPAKSFNGISVYLLRGAFGWRPDERQKDASVCRWSTGGRGPGAGTSGQDSSSGKLLMIPSPIIQATRYGDQLPQQIWMGMD